MRAYSDGKPPKKFAMDKKFYFAGIALSKLYNVYILYLNEIVCQGNCSERFYGTVICRNYLIIKPPLLFMQV